MNNNLCYFIHYYFLKNETTRMIYSTINFYKNIIVLQTQILFCTQQGAYY